MLKPSGLAVLLEIWIGLSLQMYDLVDGEGQECHFLTVQNRAIMGYNDDYITGVSEQGCLLNCLRAEGFQCRSVDYKPNTEACWLSADTRYTVGAAYVSTSLEYYYELTCEGGTDDSFRSKLYQAESGQAISGSSPLYTGPARSASQCLAACLSQGIWCYTAVAKQLTSGVTCELYSDPRDEYTLVADVSARLFWITIDVTLDT